MATILILDDTPSEAALMSAVAQKLGRRFVLVDNNPEAIQAIKQRLGGGMADAPIEYVGTAPQGGTVEDSTIPQTLPGTGR